VAHRDARAQALQERGQRPIVAGVESLLGCFNAAVEQQILGNCENQGYYGK